MNQTVNTVKVGITAVTAALSSFLGILYIPVLLLVACNLIDYVTGLIAAPKRSDGKISSYRSINGIQKKVTMWLLVVVGAIVDQLLAYALATVGIRLPISCPIACLVAIWLICNEVISILENIKDIGVNLPPFLMPILKNIKGQTEKAATIEEESEDVENDKSTD